jgi:succinoglycan biosynthesis protein ExoM
MPQQPELHLAIAICTRRRRAYLGRALGSLARLQIPQGLRVTVVVVENDSAESVRDLVESRVGTGETVYFLEPEAGLSPARNRCLELALTLGADWIAFCDDDTEASSGWVAAWFRAAKGFADARAFIGRSTRVFPKETPEWFPMRVHPVMPTGSRTPVYTTANAFIRRDVFASDGLAMRFDEGFRFSGGEDSEFLDRLARKGHVPLWIEDALNFERYGNERISLRFAMNRRKLGGNINARILRLRETPGKAATRNLHRWLRLNVNGVANALRGLVVMPFSRVRGLRYFWAGKADILEASGIVQAYFSRPAEEYRGDPRS